MSEPYLPMSEIKKKYPNEWVLLDDAKTSRVQEILGGRVVIHTADRAEFLRLFEAWDSSNSTHTASWYTGEFPVEEILPVESEPGAA